MVHPWTGTLARGCHPAALSALASPHHFGLISWKPRIHRNARQRWFWCCAVVSNGVEQSLLMKVAGRSRNERASGSRADSALVDLALQGGGAHGAFTWGVLDRLLEEPTLQIEGISGT